MMCMVIFLLQFILYVQLISMCFLILFNICFIYNVYISNNIKVVKFWKRTSTTTTPGGSGTSAPTGGDKNGTSSSRCLEFVKSYSSHVGPILALCTSQPNGDSACSIGYDGVIKFYDVATFDVSGMIRTGNNNNNDTSVIIG